MSKRVWCGACREDGALCTLEQGHYGQHSYAGTQFFTEKPIVTTLLIHCPTCREHFELGLRDGGAMWGNTFEYQRPGSARRWLPRLRAFFRMIGFR